MIIWPEFCMGQYRDDDHRDHAPLFTWMVVQVNLSSNPLSPDSSKENENEIKNEPDPNPSSSPTEQPPKEENIETDDHPKIDDPNKFQDVSEIRRAISLHNIWKVKNSSVI